MMGFFGARTYVTAGTQVVGVPVEHENVKRSMPYIGTS
jgi:hypothetical protein